MQNQTYKIPYSQSVMEFCLPTSKCNAPDVQTILTDARRNGHPPGQQRAFVMAKVLEKTNVVIVGSECPDLVAACKMIPAATMEDAIELASQKLGLSCNVLIVPHAMLTLPVIQKKD
jgi:hypothetical protein